MRNNNNGNHNLSRESFLHSLNHQPGGGRAWILMAHTASAEITGTSFFRPHIDGVIDGCCRILHHRIQQKGRRHSGLQVLFGFVENWNPDITQCFILVLLFLVR